MSRRNERDEPLATGGEDVIAPTEIPVMRVSSSDVPSATPPRIAHSGGDDGGSGTRGGREVTGSRDGFFQRTKDFINETISEMRRVSWPGATEVKNTTIITIIAVIFFAIYLFVVDRAWTFLIAQITRLMGWLLGSVG